MKLYNIWKIISVATIIGILSLFSLFFLWIIEGYIVYITEPNLYIAITEFFLINSALAFMLYPIIKKLFRRKS